MAENINDIPVISTLSGLIVVWHEDEWKSFDLSTIQNLLDNQANSITSIQDAIDTLTTNNQAIESDISTLQDSVASLLVQNVIQYQTFISETWAAADNNTLLNSTELRGGFYCHRAFANIKVLAKTASIDTAEEVTQATLQINVLSENEFTALGDPTEIEEAETWYILNEGYDIEAGDFIDLKVVAATPDANNDASDLNLIIILS